MPDPVANPPVPDAGDDPHRTAVLIGNELLRELCAGELRAADVPARAADLAADVGASRLVSEAPPRARPDQDAGEVMRQH